MRVVREYTHLTASTQHIGQVVTVIGIVQLLLLLDLFSSYSHESGQVNLSIATLQETLVKDELVQVDILEHVVNFVIWLAERLWDIDAHLLFQIDEYNDPVCLAACLKIVLVEGGDAKKFEDLVFVDILTHVADDVGFQFFKLEELA